MIINQYLKNELNIDDNSESPNTCSENMYDDYENLNEETYNKEMSELLDYNIRIQSELYLKDDGANPTGSLKDRASYLVAAFANLTKAKSH